MYVTVLQALDMAIEALSEKPNSEEKRQAIRKLKNLKEKDMRTHWTKELVFKTLDQWKEDHGRNPTTTNLGEPGMPKVYQIQKLFDMKATAFLNIYYPNERKKKIRTPYTEKTKEEYIELFIEEFNRIRPKTGREYNLKRDPKLPTWHTIAKYAGVITWNKLIEISKVDTSCMVRRESPHSFIVEREVELYDKLLSYLDEDTK